MFKRTLLLMLLLALPGCSDNALIPPPTTVAGQWNLTDDNGDVATFTGCSGALLLAQGLTWDTAGTVGGVSVTDLDPSVTQNGSTWTVAPITVNGITFSGSGTVTGNNISGSLTGTDPSNGSTLIIPLTGTASGNTLALTVSMIEFGTGADGQCDIVPSLELSVAIL